MAHTTPGYCYISKGLRQKPGTSILLNVQEKIARWIMCLILTKCVITDF